MERYYQAALTMVPGLGNSRLNSLVAFFGSARQAWMASRRDLFLCGCLDETIGNNILAQREKIDIHKMAAAWEQKGIGVVCAADAAFPDRLRRIFDPPQVLYYRGRLPVDELLIAVVGARRASAYGRNAALSLAAGLAAAGAGVVSGAARGVDSAAHEGALSAGGYTVAVLGCGVDVVYPPENGRLLARIAEQGAIVSEYWPGTDPLPHHFPVRNRIISGLARGVAVVEAAEKSGSLITADWALEQGRDVFAVPGSIFSATSAGANKLIKQGAKPVTAAADILEEYGLTRAADGRPGRPEPAGDEGRVWAALSCDTPLTVDELIMRVGLPAPVVTYILLQLVLKDLAAEFGGQRYVRLPGRESGE
ncbi:DNA-processing protein DprA [Anaeroselena agilis]|uniref:DNA-processing protein DprA n=1 Tax=Anaeroselena agilis TaxID=3063788 RepID=A0ABU3NYD7_9FIRM|nr:DNA-processing protein DprA [Selenomonadales bacterium 4137-cl]